MKTAGTNLIDFLAALSETPSDTSVFSVDLFTVVLNSTPVVTLNFTNADQPITTNYGEISGLTLGAGGSGYAVGDTLGVGGSGTAGSIIVDSLSGSAVATFHASNNGINYLPQNGVRTFGVPDQPGSGTGCTLNITSVFATPITYNILTPGTPDVPVVNRVRTSAKRGLEVTTLEFEAFLLPTMRVNGFTMLQAILLGLFDSAAVTVQRLTMPTWNDRTLGLVTVFAGYIADVTDVTRTTAKFSVKSWTDLLNVQMPRNLITPGCRHSLYDAGCTVNKASFTYSGVVQSGSTFFTINTNLSQAGPLAAPAAAPTLSEYNVSKANVGPQTYYACTTYITADGETLPGPSGGFYTGSRGDLLKVTAPPFVSGAVGYNVYVGFGNGFNQQAEGSDGVSGQATQSAPYPLSYNWSMPGNGWNQGPPPPAQNTSGFFTLGVITFTSGANSGLSYVIQDYQNAGGANGIITLVRGMLATPAPGDTFTIVAGCDKAYETCINKFSNLANFAGEPWVPTPEAMAGGAGGQGT